MHSFDYTGEKEEILSDERKFLQSSLNCFHQFKSVTEYI